MEIWSEIEKGIGVMSAQLLPVTDADWLSRALAFLSRGQPVIIPTETIYGLTADAENRDAVSRVYEIKGRSLSKTSAIFLPSITAIGQYARIEHAYAHRIIGNLLPGPLTVVLRSTIRDWPGVVGDDGKIGIRVSSDPDVTRLVTRCGKPLIATSANRSGVAETCDAQELCRQFKELVPLIVFREAAVSRPPSTVIDLSETKPNIIRAGAVPVETLLKFVESEEAN